MLEVQKRVEKEREELGEKIFKLDYFLKNKLRIHTVVDVKHHGLMVEQLGCMKKYSQVLGERIEAFKGDTDSVREYVGKVQEEVARYVKKVQEEIAKTKESQYVELGEYPPSPYPPGAAFVGLINAREDSVRVGMASYVNEYVGVLLDGEKAIVRHAMGMVFDEAVRLMRPDAIGLVERSEMYDCAKALKAESDG